MTGVVGAGRRPEFGLVRSAVAFTLLAGAVAVVVPFLSALVVALAAISLAGTARPGSLRLAPARVRRALEGCVVVTSVAIGGLLFVVLPVPWSIGRGLVLGASLLPLAALARGTPDTMSSGDFGGS